MIEHDETKSTETHSHHKSLQLFKAELTFIALLNLFVHQKHSWLRQKERDKKKYVG